MRILRWVAGIFLAALLGFSIWASMKAGTATTPKYWIVFALLAVAAVGYHFRLLWLRQLTLLGSLAYLGFYLAGCPCTTGGFEMVFVYLGMAEWAKIGVPLLRVAVVAAVVFLLGNLFCGWVCFKGAVQEFLFRRHLAVRVPAGLDRWLKRFRYLVLALVVAYPLIFHNRIFNQVDPFRAAMNFTGTWVLVNKAGRFQLRVSDPSRCVDGKICAKSCPMQALEKPSELKVDKAFCIACMECSSACPKNCLG